MTLVRYFKAQVEEIQRSFVLRIYGCCMSFLLVLTGFDWLKTGVSRALGQGSEAICWPMFPHCQDWRIIDSDHIQAAVILFFSLSLINLILFALPRFTKPAFWMLFALNLLKLAIIAFDFRFRLNQHIMAFWITMAFLFFPKKIPTLKTLIVLFYFWAGLLKLNPEWLSGAALYKMPWLITPDLAPYACTYVVILEVILIFGLLLDRSKIAVAVFLQLLIFHLFSWPVVGYFYPVIMLSILAIFPLSWKFEPQNEKTIPRTIYVLVLVFSLFQLVPRLMPGDTAITGEGRLFALHMFDAKTECEAYAEVITKDGNSKRVNLFMDRPMRIHCDPITYLSRARFLCMNEKKMNPDLYRIDLKLKTKRTSESVLHSIVDEKDFCSKDLPYSLFSHNSWIHAE